VNEPFVFINDEILPASQATLLVSDLSIQRGYGIFDFLKTIGNTPIFAADHLDRFLNSANRLRLPVDKNRSEMLQAILSLMDRNNIPDSGIRLTLTGGYSADGYTITRPNLVITQQPLQLPDSATFEKGISLITWPHQRQMPDVKTIDYLMAVWLQPQIKEQTADDVLYHRDGILSECPRSNFFIVTANDTIVTPAQHILRGVIRGKVLTLAGREYKTVERPVSREELTNAREAFITSTTKHILPVVRIDGQSFGDGKPGKMTRWLSGELNRLVYANGHPL
jgi:branched-chain amino acid aminotransferase